MTWLEYELDVGVECFCRGHVARRQRVWLVLATPAAPVCFVWQFHRVPRLLQEASSCARVGEWAAATRARITHVDGQGPSRLLIPYLRQLQLRSSITLPYLVNKVPIRSNLTDVVLPHQLSRWTITVRSAPAPRAKSSDRNVATEKAMSTPAGEIDQMAAAKEESVRQRPTDVKINDEGSSLYGDGEAADYLSIVSGTADGLATPSTPGFTTGLSRTTSSTDVNGDFERFDQSEFPPVDRLTMFDILENLALPQRLEKMQSAVHNQAEKVRRQRAKLASRALSSKNTVDEWRKKVKLNPDEQLDKYRSRMKQSVDRMSNRWNDAKTVTLKEKISFVVAVLNIFISAYLIGAYPEYFHYWYTAQLA